MYHKEIRKVILSTTLIAAMGIVAVSSRLFAQAKDDVLKIGFEEGVAGWISLDSEAQTSQEKEKANIHSGSGALQFSYKLREGGLPIVALTGISIAGAQSIEFYAKCSHATGLGFGLSEQNEASYGTISYIPANTWVRITVNLDELQLGEDSKDDNGSLDIDKVASFWLVDVGAFGQALNPDIRGARTLWIDDIRFSRAKVDSSAGIRVSGTQSFRVVDSFESGLLRWAPLSVTFDPVKFVLYPSVRYDITTDIPEGGGKSAMKISYARPQLSAFAIVRDVHGVDLKKAKAIVFWVRVDKPGIYLANLEKKNEARYQQSFTVSPNLWTRIELPISQFSLAEDSKDPDGGLDMATVKSFSILDINLQMQDAGENTLYLDEVTFMLE